MKRVDIGWDVAVGREVDDLTFDFGDGCFPRFVELTPRILKILLAASRRVSLPLEPLFTLTVNPLIATQPRT